MTSRAVTITVYLVLAGAMVALDVYARHRPDRAPTLGRLLSWTMRRRSTQLGLLFAWWWAGWHFFIG